MTSNESLARLCIATLAPYMATNIYELQVTFHSIATTESRARLRMHHEIESLVDYYLPALLKKHRHYDHTATHNLQAMVWLNLAPNPAPLSPSGSEPTCRMLVGLPCRERAHENFAQLVKDNEGDLLRACPTIKSIRAKLAPQHGDIGPYIENAFTTLGSIKNFRLVEHYPWFDEWDAFCDPDNPPG